MGDITVHQVPGVITLNHQFGKVLSEQVPNHLQGEIRLAVQQFRGLARLNLLLYVRPTSGKALHVAGQVLLRGALCSGTHDHPSGVRNHRLENILQASALGVRQLPGDTRSVPTRYIDQETTGQADLGGETRSLGANGILAHLHQYRLARRQDRFDLAWFSLGMTQGCPVDLTGVQHCISALADVDEGCLHRGKYVLHLAEVDIADQRGL